MTHNIMTKSRGVGVLREAVDNLYQSIHLSGEVKCAERRAIKDVEEWGFQEIL